MRTFTKIKEHPELFLLISLVILCLSYLLCTVYTRYSLNDWYDKYIDKNPNGLRVFYYARDDWKGAIKKTEIVKELSYSDLTDKEFRNNDFSLRAIGIFFVPETGRYKFFLKSDDGSRLYIDQNIIIDNFGTHPSKEICKTIPLKTGPHLIVIEYFQRFGKASLDFSWLKTIGTKRSNDLKQFFHPVISDFQWEKDINQFDKTINTQKTISVFLLWIAGIVAFIWFILRFWKWIYSLWVSIYETRNYPVIRHLIKLAPYITILASGIIAYRKVIFSTGPAIQYNDMPVLFYPTYFFLKQAFVSGQIPFWDPHLLFGQPFLFNLGLCLLYPPLLLLVLLSGAANLIPRHLELFSAAHLALSGITMYWGMRKIGVRKAGACLGAIIFQLFIGNQELIVWPSMSFGLPWVPLANFYFFSCLSSNKEKPGNWNPLRDGTILILSLFMLISLTHPHLLAYTYFQSFLVASFFIIRHLSQKNFSEAFNCIKKSIFYTTAPIFLAAFIILPILYYLPQTTRWIPTDLSNIGPLYRPYFATIILPIINWYYSAPYAYIGIVTILLACGYCLLVNKNNRKKYDIYWVFLAVFWILFAIENSPLYSIILKHVPLMQSMRFTQRGMIFYALAVSLLAGRFLDILCSVRQRLKFQWSIFLMFPIFLILMLIYTGKPFLGLIKEYPIEIDFRSLILLASVILFGLSLFIHNKTNNPIFRNSIKILIPIWLIIELLTICKQPFDYSDASVYSPYDAIWEDYKQEYPEVYNNESGFYRVEKYNEPLIVPYYFNTYSTQGYLSQATHPRRYYYLWNDFGGWFGLRYNRFWDLAYLPFSSPIYDLMGVKYFIADGSMEAAPLPREIRGQGEWIEGTLSKPDYIKKIRLYNTEADFHRRMTKGRLDLDNKPVVSFDMPMQSGWYEFGFEPMLCSRFKLTIDEATFQVWNGTEGVMIGEMELYNPDGKKIEIDPQSLKSSSSFRLNPEHYLVDGNPESPWESGCRVALREMMESSTVKEIRRGLFINQDVLPRAFMVRKIKALNNIEELAKELHSKDFDPKKVLLLEKEPEEKIKFEDKETEDKIKIASYNLNRVNIEADIGTGGYLVLTDTYLPGWSVSVNGRPKEILRAYGYFRAVALEKGYNKITFRYFPPMLIPGIAISFLSFIFLLIIGIWKYRKQRKYAA